VADRHSRNLKTPSWTLALSSSAALLALLLAPADSLLEGVGLAALLGASFGLIVGIAADVLDRLPRALGLLAAASLGIAAGYHWLALPLGLVDKLSSTHPQLALAELVLVLGQSGITAVLAVLVPVSSAEDRRTTARMRLLSLMSITLGVLLAIGEATRDWLTAYPAVSRGLLLWSWLLVAAGLLTLSSALNRRTRLALGVAGSLCLTPTLASLYLYSGDGYSRLATAEHTRHVVALARALTDWDADGVSSWFGGADCAPFDPQVSPLAREIAGNGIDDNCRNGDAPASPKAAPAHTSVPSGPRHNIVLITVDALRANHTTPYGYELDTTPEIQRWAQSAVRFENAQSSGAWTCLALTSLFSGVYPRQLTWRPWVVTDRQRLLPFPWQNELQEDEAFLIALTFPDPPTSWWLPVELQASGYHTIAAVPKGITHFFTGHFNRGWERALLSTEDADGPNTDRAIAALEGLSAPFFLWIHYFGPHEPQTDVPGVRHFGDTFVARYDHEIAATDAQIGRLLTAAQAKPDTAVIVTADHGEALQGGVQFHGADLLEDTTRIPLLMSTPGGSRGSVSTPASLVDVPRTILGLAGIEAPPGLDGQDLIHLGGERVVLTDLLRANYRGDRLLDQSVATNRDFRLIRDYLSSAEILIKNGDLARPPTYLPLERAPRALLEALATHEERGGGLVK
jgi:hypothetical protein